MTSKANELLKAAFMLSPSEREDRADCLWASLENTDPYADMSEDELIAELDRRANELKADPASGVPWNEVQNKR
jgi:putative addiction module component (TIGR02574 family)